MADNTQLAGKGRLRRVRCHFREHHKNLNFPSCCRLVDGTLPVCTDAFIRINDLVVEAGGLFLETPETSDTAETSMVKANVPSKVRRTIFCEQLPWWMMAVTIHELAAVGCGQKMHSSGANMETIVEVNGSASHRMDASKNLGPTSQRLRTATHIQRVNCQGDPAYLAGTSFRTDQLM